ncbi:hypothetical protein BV20DRAFT_693042 [Pilatotrama ljubarskyi]|nr:hypothetical protein BV20DRAFT_693042 [Pilatotrama ljubarskyi]
MPCTSLLSCDMLAPRVCDGANGICSMMAAGCYPPYDSVSQSIAVLCVLPCTCLAACAPLLPYTYAWRSYYYYLVETYIIIIATDDSEGRRLICAKYVVLVP